MPLYPEIEPYGNGMLDVGDGNHVHWETCGNPDGKPAVVLHGMRVNTTGQLITDPEELRRHLGIDRWLVRGVSFGSVLALRYAQTHPGVVSELVPTGVATGSDSRASPAPSSRANSTSAASSAPSGGSITPGPAASWGSWATPGTTPGRRAWRKR